MSDLTLAVFKGFAAGWMFCGIPAALILAFMGEYLAAGLCAFGFVAGTTTLLELWEIEKRRRRR